MVPPTHAKFPLHGLAFSGSSDPPENIENLPSPGALRLQMHAKGSDPYNFESQFSHVENQYRSLCKASPDS